MYLGRRGGGWEGGLGGGNGGCRCLEIAIRYVVRTCICICVCWCARVWVFSCVCAGDDVASGWSRVDFPAQNFSWLMPLRGFARSGPSQTAIAILHEEEYTAQGGGALAHALGLGARVVGTDGFW